MTQTFLPGQSDLVFIEENGLSSRYNQRMTEQELEDSKPVLSRLNEEGASRGVMTEEISRLHGRPISKSQLDRLRRELGLINRQNQRLAQSQEVSLAAEPSDASCSAQDQSRSNVTTTKASGNPHSKLLAAPALEGCDLADENVIMNEYSSADLPDAALSQVTKNRHSSPVDNVNLKIFCFHDGADPQNQHSVNNCFPTIPADQPNTGQEMATSQLILCFT